MREKGIPFLQKYGVLVAFVALCVFNAIWQPDLFLKPENLRNLLNQNAAVGMVAVGMTLVIICGAIDLSVGSVMAIAAALGVRSLNDTILRGQPEIVAVLIACGFCVLVGMLAGAINGLIITMGRVTPFIATLCGLVAYRSLALVVADGGEIRSQSSVLFPSIGQSGVKLPFILDTQGHALELTWPIFGFVVIAILGGLLLERSTLGRNIVAVGANEQAAYLAGVNTKKIKTLTFSILGLCCGFAAIASAARTNSVASAQVGLYYELDAIAAVAIGGTSMSGGYGRVWGTAVGVLILGIISNMLVTSGVSPYWQGLVKGAIILFAVMIQQGQSDRS